MKCASGWEDSGPVIPIRRFARDLTRRGYPSGIASRTDFSPGSNSVTETRNTACPRLRKGTGSGLGEAVDDQRRLVGIVHMHMSAAGHHLSKARYEPLELGGVRVSGEGKVHREAIATHAHRGGCPIRL
jgi:hypothetical protein